MTATVPGDLAGQLAIYTDQQAGMKLLGPRGWECSASYGADGSGGVAIYPDGEAAIDALSAAPYSPSSEQGIVGRETSVCQSCREGQACPLFSTAAADWKMNENGSCPQTKPAEEAEEEITPGIVAFMDPPGVAGDGSPSGGHYPANGVMTYYSGNENGSWLDTCTLPYSDHSICTTALNAFVTWYGGF